MKFNYNALMGVLLSLWVLLGGVMIAGMLTPHVWNGSRFVALSEGGIHTDGWMEEQATLTFEGFSTLGNFIQFTFDPWRPKAEGIGQIALSICGGPEDILTAADRTPVRVGLSGNCSPLTVSLRGVNPFAAAGERDNRKLSVRVSEIAVSSSLGFPIPSVWSALTTAAAVGILALLVVVAFGSLSIFSVAVAASAVSVSVLLVAFADVPASRFEPLWAFCVCLLAGISLFSRLPEGVVETRAARALAWIAVVVLGAALRFYGIGFGLPFNFHPDEVPKVNAIMRMVDQNTWNPQYFLHPSLLLYSTYFMNVILQAIGVEGTFRETAFLAGRIVSACAGTASIFLTFAIGRRLFNHRVGIMASLILAVLPLHVTCSRYLKEDSLLTFISLSCVFVTIVSVQSNRRLLLLAAGILAGFTAGTKYSGILMAVVPASAPWLASRRFLPNWRWVPWAAAAVLISPLGFLMTTPYAFLDSVKFLHDFEAESRHMQTGHTTAIDPWSQLWMYHFWRSIMPGMTEFVALASIAGLGLLIRRGRIEDLFIVGMFLLFYLPAEFVKAKPAPQPERYIVPCLPFLAIALAELVRIATQRIPARAAAGALCAFFLAMPVVRTVELASEVTVDTREKLAHWMESNLPPGSKVLMDWKPYCPRLDGKPFEVEYIPRARIIPELDIRQLKESGADYLVLSSLFYDRYFSQPEANPILRQRIREVFERVPVVLQMAPKAGTYGFHNPVLTLFSLKQEDFALLEREIAMKRSGELQETSNEVRARAKW